MTDRRCVNAIAIMASGPCWLKSTCIFSKLKQKLMLNKILKVFVGRSRLHFTHTYKPVLILPLKQILIKSNHWYSQNLHSITHNTIYYAHTWIYSVLGSWPLFEFNIMQCKRQFIVRFESCGNWSTSRNTYVLCPCFINPVRWVCTNPLATSALNYEMTPLDLVLKILA